MAQLYANNAQGLLYSGISGANTNIQLHPGNGDQFPVLGAGDFFLLTLIGIAPNGQENSWEVVKVTARSADYLTVVRGQEGTTAKAWNAGTRVELRITKGAVTNFEQAYNWGNHASVGYLTSVTWATLGEKPTTVAGFGLTDVYTKAQVNSAIASITPDWSAIQDIPATFPPSSHTHTEADITDLNDYALNSRFHISTTAPTGSDGNNGDVWYQV